MKISAVSNQVTILVEALSSILHMPWKSVGKYDLLKCIESHKKIFNSKYH